MLIGERQEAGDLTMHGEADDQRGPDVQFGQAPEFVLARPRSRPGIIDFDDLQVAEPADQPRPVLDTLAAENLRRTLREPGLAGEHRLEIAAVFRNQREECGIASRRVR